jgi:hypothetical protein
MQTYRDENIIFDILLCDKSITMRGNQISLHKKVVSNLCSIYCNILSFPTLVMILPQAKFTGGICFKRSFKANLEQRLFRSVKGKYWLPQGQ